MSDSSTPSPSSADPTVSIHCCFCCYVFLLCFKIWLQDLFHSPVTCLCVCFDYRSNAQNDNENDGGEGSHSLPPQISSSGFNKYLFFITVYSISTKLSAFTVLVGRNSARGGNYAKNQLKTLRMVFLFI